MQLEYILIIERDSNLKISRIVVPDLELQFAVENYPQIENFSEKAARGFAYKKIIDKFEQAKLNGLRLNMPSDKESIRKTYPSLGLRRTPIITNEVDTETEEKNTAVTTQDLWDTINLETDYEEPRGFFEKYTPKYGYAASILDNALDAINIGVLLSLTDPIPISIVGVILNWWWTTVQFINFPQSENLFRTGKLFDDVVSFSKSKIRQGVNSVVFGRSQPVVEEKPAEVIKADFFGKEKVPLGFALGTAAILGKLTVSMGGAYFMYVNAQTKFNQFSATGDAIDQDPDGALMSRELYYYFSTANFITTVMSDPFEQLSCLIYLNNRLDDWFQDKAKRVHAVFDNILGKREDKEPLILNLETPEFKTYNTYPSSRK